MPLGTRLRFLRSQLVDPFLPSCRDCPQARSHSLSTRKKFVSPPSNYSPRNPNVSFSNSFPPNHGEAFWGDLTSKNRSRHQASLQSDRQPFGRLHSWIIWLEDGVLVTRWGDGAAAGLIRIPRNRSRGRK